jgi:hypothetical protein
VFCIHLWRARFISLLYIGTMQLENLLTLPTSAIQNGFCGETYGTDHRCRHWNQYKHRSKTYIWIVFIFLSVRKIKWLLISLHSVTYFAEMIYLLHGIHISSFKGTYSLDITTTLIFPYKQLFGMAVLCIKLLILLHSVTFPFDRVT